MNTSIFFSSSRALGAEVNEFLLPGNALNNRVDLLVQRRFATGDHHHSSTTFIEGREAFIEAQALIEDGLGSFDLSAACAV